MIHVCRLDVGSRHVFDSADGINEVGSLVTAIEHYFSIDRQKQVLLISGGEILADHTQKLYRLSAGREESPIYLIDQSNVEKDHPPTIESPLDSLTQDMRKEIEASILLQPSYTTLQSRSLLVSQVQDLDKNLHKLCQSFYDDQYWQYQGFLALIANLDEFFSSFCKRKDVINEQFEKYQSSRDYNKELMRDIDKYIEILGNIRILPQIMSKIHSTTNIESTDKLIINTPPNASETLFNNFSSQSIADLQALQINEQQLKKVDANCLTLLEWIKSTDPQNRLDSVIDETREMLSHFDNNFTWRNLQTKINTLVTQIENNPQMREIEGLTKRLQDLNNFLEMSKKFLASQNDIVDSVKANYERAAKLKDESILQDLCKGHEKQLELFKNNHAQMIEITRKISKAKLELVRVIHSRLNWVMQIQKQLADNDLQLQIYFKQLKRINMRLKLMDHIKRAPTVYMCSMRETIRRQNFSKVYKSFAELLNNLVTRIFQNETQKRAKFEEKLSTASQHFILSILFRSLNDKVEHFMNESPLKFDTKLPQLEEADVNLIEKELISQLSNLRSSSFDSSTSSSSTSATSSSSSCQPLENSSPMFESPQNSASGKSSGESQSSSKSESKTTSITKMTRFSEAFLADMNLEEYKHDSQTFDDLALLGLLSSTLQASGKENLVPLVEQSNEQSRQQIAEIQVKLGETKDVFKSYCEDFRKDFLNVMSRQSELEKCFQSVGEELRKNESQLRSDFYSEFLAFVKRPDRGKDEVFVGKRFSEIDMEFAKSMVLFVEDLKETSCRQVDELQTALNVAKKNGNADKQKLFNEAIKRATQEKDKVIDELRLKETAYLEKISQLEASLAEAESVRKADKVDVGTTSEVSCASFDSNSVQVVSKKEDNLPVIPENDKTIESNEQEDINQTKIKLRELMLMEKVSQLEKQLSLFTTIPVTHDYETIQLNSCNIDDLVIAVYNEDYGSYKIIHKSSNYLHFVHSAIFKSHEQRLSFKNNSMKTSQIATSPLSDSPLSTAIDSSNISELQFANPNDISVQSTFGSTGMPISQSNPTNIAATTATGSSLENRDDVGPMSHSPLVKNSPSDNVQNIFLAEKQPQWFVGRVLVKEFCIARKENNRFRVPSGTRFYRVKLKPYNL